MKKYVKPMVKIVNIKSSEDIAAPTSFNAVKQNLIKNYLINGSTYAVSQYSVANSAVNPTDA